jgi:RNA polymerase sigma-70 factor (ECF subfamily)
VPAPEDEQLLRAAVAGDGRALADFVRATQPHVWRFCAYLGTGEDAADLVQETYARALRALPRFEFRSPPRAWLLSIARRVCADAVRGARRRRSVEAVWWQRERPVSDATAAVVVALALDTLSDERREAFVLTQIVGLPYAEAADICAVPVGTIRSRVARAREHLQHAVEVVGEEAG